MGQKQKQNTEKAIKLSTNCVVDSSEVAESRSAAAWPSTLTFRIIREVCHGEKRRKETEGQGKRGKNSVFGEVRRCYSSLGLQIATGRQHSN